MSRGVIIEPDEDGNWPQVSLSGSNMTENPFNTLEAENIVSTSENFWSRLYRTGRVRGAYLQNSALTNDGAWHYLSEIVPSPGTILYPKRAVVSCDVDAILSVSVTTGVNMADTLYWMAFCKAGTPLIVNFDGDVGIFDTENSGQTGGMIEIGGNTTIASGHLTGSINGVEIMPWNPQL